MAYFTKYFHPPGTAPGTLIEPQRELRNPPSLRLLQYTPHHLNIIEHADPALPLPAERADTVTWIHVRGYPTKELLQQLGCRFQLHALALEDVMNSGQRPKVDLYGNQIFVVMSLPSMEDDIVHIQQVSLFFTDQCLISFCENDTVLFDLIVQRLEDEGSRIRKEKTDFLFYSLLDLIIDQGFPVLENFGLQLEYLEEQILESCDREILERIHTVKREMILLRRMLWPQREVINGLLREELPLIKSETLVYLRDCYDHSVQVMDLLETYRDMSGSMLEIYLSSVSNRMNDIMRVLTIIATLFIPLTFIVGVYGMNFDRNAGAWSMPELGWAYGYPLVWLVMLATVISMLTFFRRRGWF